MIRTYKYLPLLLLLIIPIAASATISTPTTIPTPVNVTAFEDRSTGIVHINWDYPPFDKEVIYETKVVNTSYNNQQATFETRDEYASTNTAWMYDYDILEITVKAILPTNGIPEPIIWGNYTYYPSINRTSTDVHSNSTDPVTLQVCLFDFENRC